MALVEKMETARSSHSASEIDPFRVRDNASLASVLFCAGLFASQRFVLDPINAYVCIIPFFVFFIELVRSRHAEALASILFALFISVDHGAGAYAETPSYIRYPIYISAALTVAFLGPLKTSRHHIAFLTFLCGAILIGSFVGFFISNVPFDAMTLRRDVLVVLVLAAVLLTRKAVVINISVLNIGIIAFLLGELVNMALFYPSNLHYLNYDSLKSVVVLPLVFSVATRQHPLVSLALFVIVFSVLFMYGSRMLTLSFISLSMIAMSFYMFRAHGVAKTIIFGLLSLLVVWATVTAVTMTSLTEYKGAVVLAKMWEGVFAGRLLETLQTLDPVRYAEHQLFFDRSLVEILFGSGLGSGIYDEKGMLDFTNGIMSSFTSEEMNRSTYFGLHDFWTDFGLRFGFVSILIMFLSLVLGNMWRRHYTVGLLLGMLLVNSTFAVPGILFVSLFFKFFQSPETEQIEQPYKTR